MASPMPMTPAGGWHNPPAAATPQADDYGVQTKAMGLKVHYTFDKEAGTNFLARASQTLHVQTIAIDGANTIGIVDLRACVHAVAQSSPELTTQECDYTIYAVDYSEPDTPLVGQGLLSWTLDSMRGEFSANQQPKMVTGRVTKNLLGVFAGGNRETLEVRLKLSEATKIQRPPDHGDSDLQASRPIDAVMTPSGTAEWNSFIQSNPQIGQPTSHGHPSRMASPALSQGPILAPAPLNRQDSFGPPPNINTPPQEIQRVAPTPVEPPAPIPPAPSSRPSSRAPNRPPRRKPPTGRPRGRPRKKTTEGNTSGYEDGTEGEEGPAKKRAKTTKADKTDTNAFVAGPESLRVAASNSSSLRNFRPVGIHSDGVTSGNAQDVPRAPTPVPDRSPRGFLGRGPNATKPRQESALGRPEYSSSFSEPRRHLSPSQEDDRSPESAAPTPGYSEDSPPDIGSSPPVRRATPYIRSSPPPSSPVLPPMLLSQLPREGRFASNDVDEVLEEEPLLPAAEEELPPPRPVRKAVKQRSGVPIQVFQIQGPTGDDFVHICSYTTPHPSSSAPAPPEASSLPPLKQESTRPQASASTAKRKRPPRAPSPPPLALTPPPTTDVVDRATSPAPLDPPVPTPAASGPAPASVSISALEGTSTPPPVTEAITTPVPEVTMTPVPISEAIMTPTPELSTTTPTPVPAAKPNSTSAPTPESNSTPAPAPVLAPGLSFSPVPLDAPAPGLTTIPSPAPAPTPEASHVAVPFDESNDPIVQLASRFSMSEAPQPVRPSSQSSSHPPPPKAQITKPKPHRQLNRSQSAGPLILPSVPASAPVGPSSLPVANAPEQPPAVIEVPAPLRRSASIGTLILPVPGTAPAEPAPTPVNTSVPEEACPPGDSVPPPSSPPAPKSNKNVVKKHAIKQRLEQAINNGEMPPFCTNCGAIETPTWRKIWVQEREGAPQKCEYSEKPGRVTAMEILKRDEEDKPTLHRVIKKSLAPTDDKTAWQEMLLCNPCGIWFSKSKCHRPPDRWDKDLSRVGQGRRKRGPGRSTSRAKKNQSKDDPQANLTSEAYLPTDGLEPLLPSSPKLGDALPSRVDLTRPESRDGEGMANDGDCMQSHPGSTHSRGSGTAQSPIDIEFDEAVGNTKRLLFPSPRKDGVPKVLCDLDINLVSTGDYQQPRQMTGEKENAAMAEQDELSLKDVDLEALMRCLAKDRPSTPPSDGKSAPAEPFKTPTRPTPNHRPITRSVSRSLRSVRSIASPSQQILQRTPTRTPGSALRVPGSNTRRRSPRNHPTSFEGFDSPISRSIVQLLEEQNGFGLGDHDIDLSSLSTLGGLNDSLIDFGNLLNVDGHLPGDSAKDGAAGFDFAGSANIWASWPADDTLGPDEKLV